MTASRTLYAERDVYETGPMPDREEARMTAQGKPTLKPCPFCGGTCILPASDFPFEVSLPMDDDFVICDDCWACASADMWNRRTPDAALMHVLSVLVYWHDRDERIDESWWEEARDALSAAKGEA